MRPRAAAAACCLAAAALPAPAAASPCSTALNTACGATRWSSRLPGHTSCSACLEAHQQELKAACKGGAVGYFCDCQKAMDRFCDDARQRSEGACLTCFTANRAAFANVTDDQPCGVGKDPGEYCRRGGVCQ